MASSCHYKALTQICIEITFRLWKSFLSGCGQPHNLTWGPEPQEGAHHIYKGLPEDMCQDPKKIPDPGSCGSQILQDLGSYMFIFSWDLRDLGSCCGKIAEGSWGSLIWDRQDFVGSWGSWIQIEQLVVRSCRYWILHNNNLTVFWPSFTSNEILLLVPHDYALHKTWAL